MRAINLTYYSEEYQGLLLSDLGRFSRQQLLCLNADVVTQLISLNNQIQDAVSNLRQTGHASDHDWFRRIRSRRSLVAAFYAHLSVRLAQSKAQEIQREEESNEVRGSARRLSPHLSGLQGQASAGFSGNQQPGRERVGRAIPVVRRSSSR
jgi:hypothetical protein